MIFDSTVKIKNINISHENNGEYHINLTMLLNDKTKYRARLKLPIKEDDVKITLCKEDHLYGLVPATKKYINLGFGDLLCVNEWYDDINENIDEKNERDVNNMEKCSIISPSIDKYKLSSKIEEFRTTKKYDPYIFMNQKSMVELMLNTNDDPASYGYYDKCKIFCDSTLDYGEVELR